jgi:hypothetical protein
LSIPHCDRPLANACEQLIHFRLVLTAEQD